MEDNLEILLARLWKDYGAESGLHHEDAWSTGSKAGQVEFALSLIDQRPAVADQVLMEMYARFDGDPRVGGPDNYEAFCDAISGVVLERLSVSVGGFVGVVK